MVDAALARSFETIGLDYDAYRPGFPDRAAEVIVPEHVGTALDLGAGTGKFTELLLDRSHAVVAVEPSASMLDVLRTRFPQADAREGNAEQIPMDDGSVDVVTVAQAFHWFDREPACREISRVLVPGGTLGLLWNRSDPDCAWDRACHRIVHPAVGEQDATTDTAIAELPGFGFRRGEEVRWVERLSRSHYLRRWMTVSSFLVADAPERERMLSAVEAVLDADPQTRGLEHLELPHVTDVFVYESI